MAHTSDIRMAGTSVFSRFADLRNTLTARFAQYRVYRNTLAELETLSARELNDLGMNKHTLQTVAREAAYGAA